MSPLDPAVAVLRCWEHEDCLEHPELALACADGHVTRLGGELDEDCGRRFWPARDQHGSSMSGDGMGVQWMASHQGGDGIDPFGHGGGLSWWHGDPVDPMGGGGTGDPSWHDHFLREDME